MKIVDYLKDKSLYLAVNLMTFIIVATLMYFSNVSTVVIFMTWCIWFLPLLIYIIIEYIKYKALEADFRQFMMGIGEWWRPEPAIGA